MKRDRRLYPLSWNHQTGLAFVHRLRKALEDGAEGLEALRASVAAFWAGDLAPHFRAEEEILLPAVRESGSACDVELDRMLREHRQLAELRDSISAETDAAVLRRHLETFAGTLHDHIRFEERILFPCIERTIPSARFDAVGKALEDAVPGTRCSLPAV